MILPRTRSCNSSPGIQLRSKRRREEEKKRREEAAAMAICEEGSCSEEGPSHALLTSTEAQPASPLLTETFSQPGRAAGAGEHR